MPELKLSYFDFNGGRAEPARIAFILGGIPFEDERFHFSKFQEFRKSTPFQQVPILTLDGKEVITQSNGILRYAGKLAKLYPENPLDALRCDEIIDAVEDQTNKIGPSMSMSDEDKKATREKLATDTFPRLLIWLEGKLKSQGGDYFVGKSLSIADLRVFVTIKNLKSGILDHIPTDLTDKHAPLLNEHFDRVYNLPALAGRYD